MLPAGTKLKGQWTVGSHLGSGACAEVYRIEERDPDTKSGLVVKCIPLPNRAGKKAAQKEQQRIADTLYYEYTLYTNGLLYGFNFAPKIPRGSYGEDAGHRYMVSSAMLFARCLFLNMRSSCTGDGGTGLRPAGPGKDDAPPHLRYDCEYWPSDSGGVAVHTWKGLHWGYLVCCSLISSFDIGLRVRRY